MSSQPNFSGTQNYYASLIKRLGEAKLPNGSTLAESLTLMEIPFWDIFAPELAWRHLTTVQAAKSPASKVFLLIKPYFRNLWNSVRNLFHRKKKARADVDVLHSNSVVCLNMTPRMYEDVLAPVASYIKRSISTQVVVLKSGGRNIDVQCSTPDVCWDMDYWDGDSDCTARKVRAELRDLLRTGQLFASIDNLQDVSSDMKASLRLMVHLLLKTYLPQLVDHAVVAMSILTKRRPALIISADTSDARCRIYTVLASRIGIPSLEIQFGLAGDEAVEWRFFAADHVAVWGTDAKKALLQQGVPEASILLAGSPRHDSLVNRTAEQCAELRAHYVSGDLRPIILLASTYVDSTHADFAHPSVLQEMKRWIFESAKKHPELILAVKPHPHENVAELQKLINGVANIYLFDKNIDIRDLIVICNVFMSFGSTATIDALIAGKPSICPIFQGWPFSAYFQETGAVFVPKNAEEIESIFSEVGSTGGFEQSSSLLRSREQFLRKNAYLADGNAAKRIGDAAIQMLAAK